MACNKSMSDEHLVESLAAIQAGLDNTEPMKTVFRQVLRDTEKAFG